ncbi:MAG: adenylate kinase [Candidatus Hydrothermarchaeaceae archaeon]
MKVVVVTGTPGAGKTTVLNGALKKIGETLKIVNYGDEMFSVAEKKGIVSHRDDMRKKSPDVQKDIQRLAAKSIAEKAKGSPIIVDTHCTIKTPKGYLPGLPSWVIEELKPSQIILVEADSKDIAGRRARDTTRERDEEARSEIDEHQMINKATAMSYAVYSGATVKVVKNNDGGLDLAVEELASVLGD